MEIDGRKERIRQCPGMHFPLRPGLAATTFDNQSTAADRFEGNLDQTGTVLSLWGTVDELMTGEHDKMAKGVIRILSPDKWVHEIHDLTIGGDKTMVIETIYERKK